jgi:hypothetical protein
VGRGLTLSDSRVSGEASAKPQPDKVEQRPRLAGFLIVVGCCWDSNTIAQ